MDAKLARLGDAYVQARSSADPVGATIRGVPGFGRELGDPSREGAAGYAKELERLETGLSTVDVDNLTSAEEVTCSVLAALLRNERATSHVEADVNVSNGHFGRVSKLLTSLPSTPLPDRQAAADYLARLGKSGEYFHVLGERYRAAAADGLVATELGIRQTITQIDTYLAAPISADPFLRPRPPGTVDREAWTANAAEIIETSLRPALAKHRQLLAGELVLTGRPGEKVGICHVPGGEEAYRMAVRRETTTEFTPAELHERGKGLIAELRAELAQRGERALGESDPGEVIKRLRDDRTLRFQSAAQIVDTVTTALRAAEAALPDWFNASDLAPCLVREMDPAVAAGGVLGYYQHPSSDGRRPGMHFVNTYLPETRARFEYQALAFHESVPGHHVQIAKAQSLQGIPLFRRLFGFNAHQEGWGLYSERLADEMNLYTTELDRLGMASFDAWRASRLVVDTGMHWQGWSRQQAIDYMLDNTALSLSNIENEVDRYIAAPGQALAYMVGRLCIVDLRARAEAVMGPDFDIRGFHGLMLDSGSLPLDTLSGLVSDWMHAPAR